jgi:hypothetical protein
MNKAFIRNNNDGTWTTLFMDECETREISRFIWGKESKQKALYFATEINNRLKINPHYKPL